MDIDLIKRIVCEIITTHVDEINCQECFKHVERFAELTLTGRDTSTALPLVHDHLQHCADCREESDALGRALSSGPSQQHSDRRY